MIMDKMIGTTMDIVADNVGKLKELFPEAFTEGKIDFHALKEVLGDFVDERDERYSFTWNGKSKARMIAQTPGTGTLRPCPEESEDWESTQNIFIEGDNLEVLKLLQKSYHKKVKMIYIDPPYNTGNEFIYPDNYQDNLNTYLKYTGQVDGEGFKMSSNTDTSGRYHTNWLNMLYPRLKLARNLLTDDGAIFISIGDHEVHNLRHLLDEIFGPECFVATAIWEKADSPRNSARQFSEDHDYVLVYSRDPSWVPCRLARTDEANSIYTNPDNDPRGEWIPGDPFANKPYSKGLYNVTGPTGRTFQPPPGRYWRISEEKLRGLDADGRIWWGPNGSARPSIKRYLSEVSDLVPRTLWRKEDVGSNRTSKNELRKLFPEVASFDTPKPVALMKRILALVTKADQDCLVMDFFAGSATLGDAVMQVNTDDGGNRRWILVQLPEPTELPDYPTISEIGKARLRGAASVIREKHVSFLNGKRHDDLGFKVFKLDSTNIKLWDADFDLNEDILETYISNIKSDRSETDVLYEILIKYGLDLTLPITEHTIDNQKVFDIGMGALIICLSDSITLEVVEGIAKLKDELNPEIMRVVFKDSGFKDDVVKTNAVQILKQAGIIDVRSL